MLKKTWGTGTSTLPNSIYFLLSVRMASLGSWLTLQHLHFSHDTVPLMDEPFGDGPLHKV